MQKIIATEKDADKKIEKYLQSMYPRLPYGTLQKALRKRDIKVNGVRVGKDYIVMPGDIIEIYIPDALLNGSGNLSGDSIGKAFDIVYEDENILIANKKRGIPVHPDREQAQHTLIDLVRDYLRQNSENKHNGGRFQPSLCHRLDRNTGGLVIIAKNQASHKIIIDKIASREIKKYYECVVKGRMEKNEAVLKAYLRKDSDKSRVFISDRKMPGSLEIITAYRVLKYNLEKDLSLLEVELITGRTHQIRAHLAYIGHPIIGDGKYGVNAINRAYGVKQQVLWACRIKFDFAKSGEILNYLDGKEFSVEPGFDII